MITTFTALHDEMEKVLRQAIPALATVEAYRDEPSDHIQTPAVLIGMEEMQAGARVTGGRLAMDCLFSAYCILSTKTQRAEVEVMNMAASVAGSVNGEVWGLGGAVGRPSNITAVPGVFQNAQQGLECWIVSWQQTVHLGSVWVPPDWVNDALNPDDGSVKNPGVKPHLPPDPNQPTDLDGGFWLESCHEHPHRLEDFPSVDS